MAKQSVKKTRKSPSTSATVYDVGVRMKGNDGNLWEIVSYNGTKRWTKVDSSKSKQILKPKSGSKMSSSKSKQILKPKSGSKISSSKSKLKPKSGSKVTYSTVKKLITRKSPKDSATLFSVGTKKKGGDGKIWVVKQSSSGVNRWVHDLFDISAVKYKNKTITFFDTDKIIPKLKMGTIKRIGKLYVSSNKIGIGETFYSNKPATKGYYNIYYFNGSLIAVHESKKLLGQKFSIIKLQVDCDGGMFSFINSACVDKYAKESGGEYFTPFFNMSYNKDKDYYFIKESDFEDVNDEFKKTCNSKTPVIVTAGNMYGDGTFNVYKGDDAYWIMSLNVEKAILNMIKN